MSDRLMMMQPAVGRGGCASPEAGLLGGTNVTAVFWAQDKCYAWPGALKSLSLQLLCLKEREASPGRESGKGLQRLWGLIFVLEQRMC